MGRTSTWNNSTIQILRVPQVFAPTLKRIAKELDHLEADQELIFIYRMKHPAALKTKAFHEAAEVVLKVTDKLDDAALQSMAASGSQNVYLLDEAPALADPQRANASSYELDLAALVAITEAAESTSEPFDADAVIDQLEALQQTFIGDEDSAPALQVAEPEAAVLDLDAWQQAIGAVELATGKQTPAVAQPKANGLLDLSELSTLFAPTAVVETFDPDAVIEAVLAIHEPPLTAFDPDAVIESSAAQTLAAATPAVTFDQKTLNAPANLEAIEANQRSAVPQPMSAAATETTALTASEAVGLDLPPLQTPKLTPFNQSFFASQLFATWRHLAVQKLLAQKRTETEPWGIAVELNQLYQTQFSAMLGNHFLQGVQAVVLAPSEGKKIQLIATPGIVNQKVAGVDANAISYELDRSEPLQNLQTMPARTILPPATAAPAASSATSNARAMPDKTPKAQAQSCLEPTFASDMARLLEERQQHLATPKPPQAKRQKWFKQLLRF